MSNYSIEKIKFGSSPSEMDELADKILTREKVATSSLHDYYLIGKKKLSQVGSLFSVMNSTDQEIAVVRIEKIQLMKFGDINEAFAREEGDENLDNWKAIHTPYYSKLLSAIGKELNNNTLLVCEWFKLIDNKQLSYRTAEPDDFDKICRFPQNEEELFFMFPRANYPLTVDQLKAAIDSRFDPTIILLNKEIVGFANFYEAIEKQHCSIGNVIVSPICRNRGIGKYLIQVMEQIAIRKYNVSEIHLSCFNTNTMGILLYSNLGYVPYGFEKLTNKQNEPIALIKMKKKLANRLKNP